MRAGERKRLKLLFGWKFDRWDQQNRRCPWCGFDIDLEGDMSAEHIIPEGMGGTREFANMCVAHRDCNKKRGSNIWQDPVEGAAFWFIRDRLATLRAESSGTGPVRWS